MTRLNNPSETLPLESVEVMVASPLPRGFDYLVPPGATVSIGDYVSVPFGNRELPGVVWGPGRGDVSRGKLKEIRSHYDHLPPMSDIMRQYLEWVAWYTLSPIGAVLKMSLPVPPALRLPSSREKKPPPPAPLTRRDVQLSGMQAEAADAMVNAAAQGFSVTLLDGVTGSGKTEVYLETLARLLSSGGQALVLLPEIALSVQWLERFARRFGAPPHVWHSGLAPALRKATWRAVAHGEARVVVGARSALFLPFKDLKIIVADEEHEASFKQEDGVIYHARDMAIARARRENIPAVLVSATPSIETLANVEQGKYRSVKLSERHAGASFPDVTLIDMRREKLDKGNFISGTLRQALAENLSQGRQSMLFLNRRGYAPLLLCRACGYRFQCPHCTAWLVLHRSSPRLQCHHCGTITPVPSHCPDCQAEGGFHPCGPGVERVAEEVGDFLPEAKLSVITSDVIEDYAMLQSRIQDMAGGETDILVGTQIIAKGHHFANLTLVGVVDADLGLNGGDLRAGERTYQLMHQLAGRAGRERDAPGRVLIQSFLPDHPVMEALVSGDRDAFMEQEMEARRIGQMPPFSRLIAVIVEGPREEETIAFARDLVLDAPRIHQWEIFGPAPAPLYLLRGKYRYRILIKAERAINAQKLMQEWIGKIRVPSALRVKIDIDPYSFM